VPPLVSKADRLSDRQLATLIGAVLFVVAAWPLFFLRMPPYQDLPDHLSTVCVLLDPARYPEYISNGFFKANSLFVFSTYLMAKVIGVVPAGHAFALVVLASTAFTLPHFVLSFTDRKRLVVASMTMAPMVHNWWTLMGMLNFALAFPLALLLLMIVARQAARPTVARSIAIAAFGVLLWYAHGIMIMLVGLLATIEALVRPGGVRAKASAAIALVGPMVPVGGLIAMTIVRHAMETTHEASFGHVGTVYFQDNFSAVYDLWAHWTFGMSPLSAAGIVTAIALGVFAVRNARANVPLFSPWAFVVLFTIYWFFPHMMPGFGYVDERVLPFLWAWALVRVPASVPKWVASLLVASTLLWSAGTACDLFHAARDLDEFTAAAPEIPNAEAARLLTLNFAPRVSSTNTWNLLHGSGMYTVLRGAHPQDLWADSPSMPIRHAAPPSLVEDPVRVRELLDAAPNPEAYCASLQKAGLPDYDCEARFHAVWRGVWEAIEERYDYVLVWGAPSSFAETVPRAFAPRFSRGRLTLLGKTHP
jgi:hypothetical protein